MPIRRAYAGEGTSTFDADECGKISWFRPVFPVSLPVGFELLLWNSLAHFLDAPGEHNIKTSVTCFRRGHFPMNGRFTAEDRTLRLVK